MGQLRPPRRARGAARWIVLATPTRTPPAGAPLRSNTTCAAVSTNEPDKDQVLAYILGWIDEHITA